MGWKTFSQVLEGTDLQERMNDHEENEKDLRSADCHGYGTWDEHNGFRESMKVFL